MIRNFVAGTLWGAVVAGVGLAVVSQVAPMPDGLQDGGAGALAQRDAAGAKPAVVQPDAATPLVPKAGSGPAMPAPALPVPALSVRALPDVATASPDQPSSPEPAPAAPALPADAQSEASIKPASPAKPVAEAGHDQLALGSATDIPLGVTAPPSVTDAPPALLSPNNGVVDVAPYGAIDPAVIVVPPAAAPIADQTDAVPDAADASPPPAPEPMLDPAPPINANPAPAKITPQDPVDAPALGPQADVPAANGPAVKAADADPAPAPNGAVLQPVAPVKPAASLIAKDQPSTFLPDAAVTGAAKGVTTGRLPRVGDATADDAATPPALVDQPPVQQFAQSLDNPSGKPLFAVILRDTGGADVDRASLAALPFPVSFVVDPMAPDAVKAAAIYRAAGQEVIMLATGIPAGAQASDLEQSFQSLGAVLPQAVAVMDLATGGFQDDRPLASLVVPIVKAQGRGLITFNRGLNAADQVARRIDVPAATIFRQLDASGEDVPLIRRYLDRAAFKAAQEGRVMVLGDTRPQTIAALLEWAVEGRASSVTLAPATAVLSVD